MQTFLEYYQHKIQPQLAAIDLFLKTEEPPYSSEETAELLGISWEEMQRLMEEEALSLITKGVFLHLMEQADSVLCRMFRRERSCGSPQRYSPQEISYIYDLELSDVLAAAEGEEEASFSPEDLPRLFRRIPISDKQYQK